jgi:rod shape-determining protein MreB
MLGFMGQDLALDLGRASTQIYARGRGIVLNEPSLVLRNRESGRALRFGSDAARRDDGVAVWPVSVDGDLTRRMVRYFLRKVHGHPFSRPRLVMALGDDSTPIGRTGVRDTAFEAEARSVYLVRHALAAALGVGLPMDSPLGAMIIDIGRDTSQIAVLAGGYVVAARSVPTGGTAMNRSIADLVRYEHGLLIDGPAAEAAKRCVGASWKPLNRQVVIRGRDEESGCEGAVSLSAREVYEATRQPVDALVRAAVAALDGCPAELASDVGDRGAVLVGGGALLRGMERRLRSRLGIPVRRADQPVECVALGLGRCVDDLGLAGRFLGVPGVRRR